MIPYGRQSVDQNDIDAVTEVLRSDWLTTGPRVTEFERALADFVGAAYAVAVSSGTAALHCAMHAVGIAPGVEVIVPPITFAATANCVLYQGGTPVFTDVDSGTLLIDPLQVEKKITPRTKAVIAVDYAGQPCDYDALKALCTRYGLTLVADSCHALGAKYKGRSAGSLADLNVFSFHPVKHITTGEGGAIITNDPELAAKMRLFRNHGISTDHHQRELQGSWYYEMVDLGYNYRITDFQCSLGISQLSKLAKWIERRHEIAQTYDSAFAAQPSICPLEVRSDVYHAYHLYVVRVQSARADRERDTVFVKLRNRGIGVNVHYIPVHLHPYYQSRIGTHTGLCPVAEEAYGKILSLPMFPTLTDDELTRVTSTFVEILS